MTNTETPTSTEVVRFEVADKNGVMVQAAVPAELAERFPTLGNADEMSELIAEVFGDQDSTLSIGDLLRITVPDGKSVAFTVGEDAKKTVEGIVIVRQPQRKYWEKSIEESGSTPPDCSSRDGVNGVGQYGKDSTENPSGLCESCPLSQWHEGADGKRIPPACHQQEALLLLVGDSALPYMITVPRTSLKNFREYWKRRLFAQKMKSLPEVVTKIGLKKATNDAGTDYSELTFDIAEDITTGMSRQEKAAYKVGLLGLAAQFGEILRAVPLDRDPAEGRSSDPDGEGGYSMDSSVTAPVDDDMMDAYANAGTSAE